MNDIENPILKELMKNQVPKPVGEGYLWVNILIKYKLDGKSEIVKSFSKPAIESQIKGLIKDKKKDYKQKIEIKKKETTEEENLFE